MPSPWCSKAKILLSRSASLVAVGLLEGMGLGAPFAEGARGMGVRTGRWCCCGSLSVEYSIFCPGVAVTLLQSNVFGACVTCACMRSELAEARHGDLKFRRLARCFVEGDGGDVFAGADFACCVLRCR